MKNKQPFHYQYSDNLDHTASFESATRSFDHFIMRSGLPNGPTFATIFHQYGPEYYEIGISDSPNECTVWNGQTRSSVTHHIGEVTQLDMNEAVGI